MSRGCDYETSGGIARSGPWPSRRRNARCTGRNWCESWRRRVSSVSALPQQTPPERRLGRDVHDIGTERRDGTMHPAKRRPGQMKLFVKRQADGWHGEDLLVFRGCAVVRADDLHVVAALPQVASELSQRPGHAVDLGEICFGDERNAHGSVRATGEGAVVGNRAAPIILTSEALLSQAKRRPTRKPSPIDSRLGARFRVMEYAAPDPHPQKIRPRPPGTYRTLVFKVSVASSSPG